MLTSFESKSNRVKGISFHPTRAWVLASLHSGTIQLWDYRMGTLIDTFEEHDGPVRGIDFHSSQPMFVSGGDDYKIKVWNYKLRRCLFTLVGHLDYIRTVQFHKTVPWIVSASDDQTLRIWNWMSRSCISVLTGHNHYVMCASFHPTDDLVVSASLDQTVRVWDTSGLRQKTSNAGGQSAASSAASRVQADLFGGSDAVVKYVMEGHDRGVNWAAFHPTLPLVVSGADDRYVKLWRMNDTKAWEVDTFRGHSSNVSCVAFHPKLELIVSNSEDRTVRVWDMSRRLGVQQYRREHDRFWVLAVHPQQSVIGAGHDGGMAVLKIGRERPPFAVRGRHLFYVKDRYIRVMDLGTKADRPLCALRRIRKTLGGSGPKSVVVNPHNKGGEHVAVHADDESRTFEHFDVTAALGQSDVMELESLRSSGKSIVYVSRKKLASLQKDRNSISIKNTDTLAVERVVSVPFPVDAILQGPLSTLLVRTDERVCLLDLTQNKMAHELFVSRARRVYWSPDWSRVAILGASTVTLADRNLNRLCSVSETVHVKSGCWDKRGVFVYSTLNHVKYLLPTGDRGILRSPRNPVYVAHATDDGVVCLDRDTNVVVLGINSAEYRFKHALNGGNFDEVGAVLRSARLSSASVVGFLRRKGYSQVALHFVDDSRTRLDLALECGDLDAALQAAQALDDAACWQRLAEAALQQGNLQVVEMAYQRTKDFERLSFLYLVTGNTGKLRKMLKIAEMRGDSMSRFHNALYLGDVPDRVRVLETAGQTQLAQLAAATHGLADEAERLRAELARAAPDVPAATPRPDAALLLPPTPLLRADAWPRLPRRASASEAALQAALRAAKRGAGGAGEEAGGAATGRTLAAEAEDVEVPVWDEDDLDLGDPAGVGGAGVGGEEEAGGAAGAGWGDDLDLDLALDDDDLGGAGAGAGGDDADVALALTKAAGRAPAAHWVADSNLAADHVAAGEFKSAMDLLHRQIGAVNFAPLRPHFLRVFTAASAALPSRSGEVSVPLLRTAARVPAAMTARDGAASGGAGSRPRIGVQLGPLVGTLKAGYRAFLGGKFPDAQALFLELVHSLPLVVAGSRAEAGEVAQLLEIAREYLTALRLELTRKQAKADPARSTELAALMTHCKLQPIHLLLGLNLAMVCAYKAGNFINAASFARRVLEIPETSQDKNAALKQKARKVLQLSEKQGRNAHTIEYDERNPFVVCAASLKPIYKGSPVCRCAYCGAAFHPRFKSKRCTICNISLIGVETIGLVCSDKK